MNKEVSVSINIKNMSLSYHIYVYY